MMRTKAQFVNFFKSEILPSIREQYEQDRRIDYPARREAWNDITDAMVADRELPRAALDWVCPW